jgi:hypothetical protein
LAKSCQFAVYQLAELLRLSGNSVRFGENTVRPLTPKGGQERKPLTPKGEKEIFVIVSYDKLKVD